MAMMNPDTVMRPLGGETYLEIADGNGELVALSYNDLWVWIACLKTMHGDWAHMQEAAGMVPDPAAKRAIIERLATLEAQLGDLPPIPDTVLRMNEVRARKWFNERTVSHARSW